MFESTKDKVALVLAIVAGIITLNFATRGIGFIGGIIVGAIVAFITYHIICGLVEAATGDDSSNPNGPGRVNGRTAQDMANLWARGAKCSNCRRGATCDRKSTWIRDGCPTCSLWSGNL